MTYFRDDDGDTYGVDGDTVDACEAAAPYTATVGGDCNDTGTGAAINPGATEVCDLVDNNCDTNIDEGTTCPAACTIQTLTNGKSYGFCAPTGNTDKLSQPDAAAACTAIGAGWSIVKIDDQAEQDAVWDAVSAIIGATDHGDVDAFWTGGSVTGGVWSWADGSTFPSTNGGTPYADWHPGEPNGGADNNCVVIGRFAAGDWNDAPCAQPARYICEYTPLA